jgi:deoxyribonuclease V
MAQAGVVVMELATLEILEYRRALVPVTYPYVPGLLSFREAPVILEALAGLAHTPDVLMLDAQGIAHPRRLGLAAHLGVVLDHPTVGCAKSRLCGAHEEPGPLRGDLSWLTDADEIIGVVLRTRTHVRPVYVSIGNRMTIESAIALVLRCGGRYRLPEPTRWAHHVAGGREP